MTNSRFAGTRRDFIVRLVAGAATAAVAPSVLAAEPALAEDGCSWYLFTDIEFVDPGVCMFIYEIWQLCPDGCGGRTWELLYSWSEVGPC